MKTIYLAMSLVLLIGSCKPQPNQEKPEIVSPAGAIKTAFNLTAEGAPQYWVTFNDKLIIDTSSLGHFTFKDQPELFKGFKLLTVAHNTQDETWEMPWGEQKTVRNHYTEMVVRLQEQQQPERKLTLFFRAYDDGIGFRYQLEKYEGVDSVLITDEITQFKLTGDHKTWWQPADWDIYEHLYSTNKFSEIDITPYRNSPDLIANYMPDNAVNTPVTMKTDNGVYLSFHEADLTNYADMTLKVDKEQMAWESELVGSENLKGKANVPLPFATPWRTIQIADRAGDLIESKLIVNLNDPNVLGDVSYFKPMKYMGIWWEMHLGESAWDMEAAEANFHGKKIGKHGATTENTIRYIDFASANGIKGLLIEGWNTGWNNWFNVEDRENVFDFTTPYADYDIEKVSNYAQEKGVEIIMHHETSAAPRAYEKHMDAAYDLMKKYGMENVKTGYVGKIIPKGEYHHGQWMVNHYQKVLEKAAARQIAVDVHEPIKATGKRRTYPNAISREGLRGQEFNAWARDGGNPPNHLPIVAFTRMLAGPIDYTPGIFDTKFERYNRPNNRVRSTIAQQLALYVVLYSPIQMAADLPENYMKDGKVHPAFQFITDVGVDWDQSLVLDGEIGEFVVIARDEKGTDRWFVGGITNEVARDYELRFNFLPKGQTYKATIYKDGPTADWDTNPSDIVIEEVSITSESSLLIHLAAGGGFAISLAKQ